MGELLRHLRSHSQTHIMCLVGHEMFTCASVDATGAGR